MKQRIVTGGLLSLIVLLAICYLNNTAFNILVAALLLLAAWEWSSIINAKRQLFPCVLYLIMTSFLLLISSYFTFTVLVISAVFWLLSPLLIYSYTRQKFNNILSKWLYIIGFGAIVPFGVATNLLHDKNPLLLIVVLITVSCADSGAYFIGNMYGKRQLSPKISPQKTTEGLFGGVLFGCSAGFISSLCLDVTITQVILVNLLNFFIVIIALLGDLTQSILKRISGIKDSGWILPGHGGILDRLDSILSSVPCFTLCAVLIRLIMI